jgi:hypothetical protein
MVMVLLEGKIINYKHLKTKCSGKWLGSEKDGVSGLFRTVHSVKFCGLYLLCNIVRIIKSRIFILSMAANY